VTDLSLTIIRDIIIHDNEKGTCLLVDSAVAGDRNMIKKEAELILKCSRNTAHVECEKTKIMQS
jgi:hypothetical protein